jgi:hypothetical protein
VVRAAVAAIAVALALGSAAAAGAPSARATVNVVVAGAQSCEYVVVGSAFGGGSFIRGTAILHVRLGGRFVAAGRSPLLPNGWFVITGGPDQDKCFNDRDPKAGRFRVQFVGARGFPSGLSRTYRVTCEILGFDRSCKPRAVTP